MADADNKLDAQIKANADAINKEINDRKNADANIQSELDNTQKGAGLANDGSYQANSDANYISKATSLADADNKLDSAIKANADAIDAEVARAKGVEGNLADLSTDLKDNLVEAINSEVDRAKKVEDNLQKNIDNLDSDLHTNYLNKTTDDEQSVKSKVVFNNDIQIKGDLIVEGSKTEIETEILKVKDNIITLNNSLTENDDPKTDAGIEINRGKEGVQILIKWDETNDITKIVEDNEERIVATRNYVDSKVIDEENRAKSAEKNLQENIDNLNNDLHTNYLNKTTDEIQNVEANVVFKNGINFVDNNTKLTKGSNNSIKVETNNGSVDIGAQNDVWCHFNTDRDKFYFNKELRVDGILGIYETNTYLTSTDGYINGSKIWTEGNDGSGSGLDADKLDGLDSSQFVRSDEDTTLNGKVIFNNSVYFKNSIDITNNEIVWYENTDWAKIGFYNIGDDKESYLYFETGDNNTEYFKWRHHHTGDDKPYDVAKLFPNGTIWTKKYNALEDTFTSVYVSNEAPDPNKFKPGDLWFDSDDEKMYMLYIISGEKQWVEL